MLRFLYRALGSGMALATVGVMLAASARGQSQPPVAAVPASAASSQTAQGNSQSTSAEKAPAPTGFQELVAMLGGIDPYRPHGEVAGKIQVYGSTSMDPMVHAWAEEFKLFYPQVSVEISAAGSGDAFEKLKQNPQALVMLSRPVKPEELKQITGGPLKEPAAFTVAREALGVFVHASNPAQSISAEQMRAVFTKATPESELTWKLLGLTGQLADQPIRVIARAENSGTQSFLREFVFGGMEMRFCEQTHGSNGDVLGALAGQPHGIAICSLRANGLGVRALPLVAQGHLIPSDDTAVLGGSYPLTRNLTLVVDLSQKTPEALAAQELVHFALCRSGQLAAIRAGFFPAELSALRAGTSRLDRDRVR